MEENGYNVPGLGISIHDKPQSPGQCFHQYSKQTRRAIVTNATYFTYCITVELPLTVTFRRCTSLVIGLLVKVPATYMIRYFLRPSADSSLSGIFFLLLALDLFCLQECLLTEGPTVLGINKHQLRTHYSV